MHAPNGSGGAEEIAARDVRGACPMDCPDTCSWLVTVEDGAAVKLRADREHRYTRGALCAKLNRYLEHVAAPDRLLQPLRRTGPKGSDSFEPISWETAFAEIAERWRTVIDRHGAEAIWPYYGTGSLGLLQGALGSGRRLWNSLGASQHVMSICAIAGQVGTEYVMGARVGMDPETIAHSGLVLLWGANPVSTGHHMWKFVDAARKQGAHVVAIDPVRTRTAEKVDEHLAPLPGTDGALALALLNVVVERGGADEDYLAGNALGWEALRGRIAEWPPQRAAQVCGLEEATIAALGERLARTRPTAIKLAMGMQRHAGGGEAVRLISCIPAVTGDWRHLGGGVTYDTRGFFGGDWQALWRDDDLRPPGTRSLVMTQLASSLRDADPPVEALFVYNANPVVSNPAQREVRRELAREDLFTVVVDHFLTDTARLADIVLPATMQPEHADLHLGYGHLYVAWNEPAVAPRGECLPNSEIFRRLAAALDLDEPCLYDSDEEMARAVLGSGHPSLEGITLERLRREGSVRLALPDPFVPFEQGFPTPSGRVELVSERAAADGFDAVPNFVPPTEVTSADAALADYPLSLIVGASHFFLNSIFANKPALADKQGPPLLAMHPADAETRELADGEAVEIFNARGSWRATLSVSDGVRPGVVAATKGRWLASFDGESSPNATVAERDADMGHGAVFHDNRVQVSGLRERLEAV